MNKVTIYSKNGKVGFYFNRELLICKSQTIVKNLSEFIEQIKNNPSGNYQLSQIELFFSLSYKEYALYKKNQIIIEGEYEILFLLEEALKLFMYLQHNNYIKSPKDYSGNIISDVEYDSRGIVSSFTYKISKNMVKSAKKIY